MPPYLRSEAGRATAEIAVKSRNHALLASLQREIGATIPRAQQGRFCAGTGIIIGRTEIIIVRNRSVRNAASIQAPATTSMFELHGSHVHPDKGRFFADDMFR